MTWEHDHDNTLTVWEVCVMSVTVLHMFTCVVFGSSVSRKFRARGTVFADIFVTAEL